MKPHQVLEQLRKVAINTPLISKAIYYPNLPPLGLDTITGQDLAKFVDWVDEMKSDLNVLGHQ